MANVEINNKEISVEQMRNDWAMVLMTRGVVVKLSVSKWPALAKLTPEILGLKFVDGESYKFSRKYLNLGRQKLLPPAVMKEINKSENEARSWLAECSFNTVWGHFLPFIAFDEWEQQNTAIRNKFMEQARILGNKYDEIISTVRNDYKNLAKDVWARLYPDSSANPTPAFVEDFVSKIISKIPSREEIVASFKYDMTYFIIPMPSFIENDLAKASQIKIQSELEKETKRRISEDYVSKKKELIDGFLTSTIGYMRKYVGEICSGVLQSIKQSALVDSLTIDSVNKIKAMTKKVKMLNFYDDSEIANILGKLDDDLDKIKGETDNEAIAEKLREIVDISNKEFVPKDFNPSISVLEP